jgi:hypothetical protein
VGYGMRDRATGAAEGSPVQPAQDALHRPLTAAFGVAQPPQPSQQQPSSTDEGRIAAIFSTYGPAGIERLRVLEGDTDDVNMACFHPTVGYGFVFGTRHGSMRSYGFGRKDPDKQM